MHSPALFRITGFVFAVVPVGSLHVTTVVVVFGMNVATDPPANGTPLLSLNCMTGVGSKATMN
jgi:hypothetical protein